MTIAQKLVNEDYSMMSLSNKIVKSSDLIKIENAGLVNKFIFKDNSALLVEVTGQFIEVEA